MIDQIPNRRNKLLVGHIYADKVVVHWENK